MFFSYAESAGWLTWSGTMSRTVGWTVVDISCSAGVHDKQELGDDGMKLSAKENLADFFFFVSPLFSTLISHLGHGVIRPLSHRPPLDTTSVHLTQSHKQ